MKIAILAYRQNPYISANTNIAYLLGEQLVQHHDVVYIGRRQDTVQDDITNYHSIRIRFLNEKPMPNYTRFHYYAERLCFITIAYFRDALSLRKIIKEEKVDALICFTAPNDDAYIALSAKLNIPMYLYQLDPFYNIGNIENIRLKRHFISCLKNFRHVFTTQLLYKAYYQDDKIQSYLDKISVLQFPKICEYKTQIKNVNDRIVLLYAGSIYSDRNPQFLIDVERCLPKDAVIRFCGICQKEADEIRLKKSGIQVMGYCSQEVLQNEIADADILINIGNKATNQLPSKTIDYISTGKPILNIVQDRNCPTIPVLEGYKVKLTIMANEILKNRVIIEKFISEKARTIVPFSQISEQYYEYTPEYVSNIVEQVLSKQTYRS